MPVFEAVGARAAWETGRQVVRAIPRGIAAYRFGKFFGKAALKATSTAVVLDPYEHPQDRSQARYIKRMLGRTPDLPVIGEDLVLGVNSVRNIAYFSRFFTDHTSGRIPIPFQIDSHAVADWNRTYFCIGSPDTNVKTFDVFALPEQRFVTAAYDHNGMRVWQAGGSTFGYEQGSDKAVLLKLRNPHFPKHWLIVCAGLGEWGSTGAVWYLTAKWRELYSRFRLGNFCMILAVTPGNDESAREVASWHA